MPFVQLWPMWLKSQYMKIFSRFGCANCPSCALYLVIHTPPTLFSLCLRVKTTLEVNTCLSCHYHPPLTWGIFPCESQRSTNYHCLDATSKQILQQKVHTHTQKMTKRTEPKVTRITASSPAAVQRGRYLLQWCQETCEQRVWLFLDIFSTPVPRVHWVGISNFITCHKRDTGCSGEQSTSSNPPHHHLPLTRHHTRPWKSCLEREDKDFPSGSLHPLASRCPYCLLAPNWSEGCEIIWSSKTRNCIYLCVSTECKHSSI